MQAMEWQTYLALQHAGPNPHPIPLCQLDPPPWGKGEVEPPGAWDTHSAPLALSALLERRRSTCELWHDLGSSALRQVLALSLARPAGRPGSRPYPTSGGLDELGILVAARAVIGMPQGAYWATGAGGRLLHASPLGDGYDAFERAACPFLEMERVGPAPGPPAAILLVFADWARLEATYTHCVLVSALWDCGALLQTLALAASTVGINACPCACVQPQLVGEWLGLDCRQIGHIGTIALGGRPAGERGGGRTWK